MGESDRAEYRDGMRRTADTVVDPAGKQVEPPVLKVLAPEFSVLACRRPWLIAAVRAVTVLVIDLGHGDLAAPIRAVEVSGTRVEPARGSVENSELGKGEHNEGGGAHVIWSGCTPLVAGVFAAAECTRSANTAAPSPPAEIANLMLSPGIHGTWVRDLPRIEVEKHKQVI